MAENIDIMQVLLMDWSVDLLLCTFIIKLVLVCFSRANTIAQSFPKQHACTMQQYPLLHFVAFGMVLISTVLHSVVFGRLSRETLMGVRVKLMLSEPLWRSEVVLSHQ